MPFLNMDYTMHYDSPLGGITIATDGLAIIGLWFDGQKNYAETLYESQEAEPDLPISKEACQWLDIYFSGRNPDFTPPILMRASEFRKSVWEQMLAIPYGQTTTYGDIARRLARVRGTKNISPQAVGGAVSHNSISLIIPCHRVIGADGSLTGYAAGIERKVRLLQLEGILPAWPNNLKTQD